MITDGITLTFDMRHTRMPVVLQICPRNTSGPTVSLVGYEVSGECRLRYVGYTLKFASYVACRSVRSGLPIN